MATLKQIEANRRNAQKSTGPKTPEGKARSSRNALQHGLAAKNLILCHEDDDEFFEMLDEYIADFRPRNRPEMNQVEAMVIATWQQQRAWELQTAAFFQMKEEHGTRYKADTEQEAELHQLTNALLKTEGTKAKAITLLKRYETAAQLTFSRALSNLTKLRKSGLIEEVEEEQPKAELPAVPEAPEPKPTKPELESTEFKPPKIA